MLATWVECDEPCETSTTEEFDETTKTHSASVSADGLARRRLSGRKNAHGVRPSKVTALGVTSGMSQQPDPDRRAIFACGSPMRC